MLLDENMRETHMMSFELFEILNLYMSFILTLFNILFAENDSI